MNQQLPEEVLEYFKNGRKKIIKVLAKEDYTLELTFDNQEIKIYDMKEELEGVFAILKDIQKFKEVFIDDSGNIAWDIDNTIDSRLVWNNRIDLCKDSLYIYSKRKESY